MIHTASFPTAVVILSYNSQHWHELFLPLIVEESDNLYDVFVVDHASTNPISDTFKSQFPTVHWLQLTENHGFAWGYAQALNQIQAKYYVLISADFEVTQGWLAPLQAKMESDGLLAACQPKIRYYKEREKFEYAGGAGGFMDQWGYLYCRGRIFDTLEVDGGQYDDDIEVFWASGGCLMVRSEVYHRLGGLDADFYAHMEEIDLCWRFKNSGYKVGYVHDSLVFHVGGSVISYGSPQKTYYNYRNSYYLFLKNEQGGKLIWLIPLRLVLDGISGIQLLLQGKWKNCLSIIKAHFGFYANILNLLKKRRKNKQFWHKRNENGITKNKIIIEYFFNKKKKFSELGIINKIL